MMAQPNRHAVAGRRGGLKGGPARMAQLSPEAKSELGRKGAMARWAGRFAHQVVKQMLETIAVDARQYRLYRRDSMLWFAPAGHLEESRWMEWCVGTYEVGASFTAVIEDVVEM